MAMNTLNHPELFSVMTTYFFGEKTEAFVFILPLGLLLLVFGAWLWVDSSGGFMRGVAMPLIAMGLLMGTVGAVVGLRTPSQLAQLQNALEQPSEVAQTNLKAEIARIAKVNAAWKTYLVMWGLMGVVGLCLRFASQSELLQGMGIALVVCCGFGLMVDGFAERRAHTYEAALVKNQPR